MANADVIDLTLHRTDDLVDLVDPCSECSYKPYCNTTCARAVAWWDKLAKKFNRNATLHKLGGV